ncbi:MAG: hypothetical protein EXR71_19765 [Myxococcales bacterium]|nr:hypothetical protein [Myxococcales bacterium]
MWWLASTLAAERSGTLTGTAGEPVVGASVYNGLDAGRDDGAEDADGDGFTNAEERGLDTDPIDPRAAGDCMPAGCATGVGLLPLGVVVARVRRRRHRA